MSPISDNNPQDTVESFNVPTIGIIYPPPELRNIVDKTAGFVARNGPDFEARIRQNEISNAKFNFLNPGDPYHAYYQHKVKELHEGKIQEEMGPPAVPPISSVTSETHHVPKLVPIQHKPEIMKMIEPKIVPKEPPKEFEYVVDPPSISALELDIVKLTAQFVARNGKNFQTNLLNREQRNFQFDFLRPQHSLFPYFRRLVEQYTKVLISDNNLTKELQDQSSNPEICLDDVRYRVEWIRLQESEKKRREEDEERERVQYAQIDWHDFTVVETVDYLPSEQGNFPAPTTPQEVGTRALLQQRFESEEIDVEMEVESDEEESSKTTNSNSVVVVPPPPPPASQEKERFVAPPLMPVAPPEKVVVKTFDPQQKKPAVAATVQKFLISPITGERIPADKMEEHMRIGLLDPRWVEQRDKHIQEKIAQEEVFAHGSSIESSLKHFAERRTDIFGQEETGIGMRVGEEEDERQPERPIWDGHSASAEAVTRQARANITVEQQIQQIHKMKGLIGDDDKEKIGPAKPKTSLGVPSIPQMQSSGVRNPALPPSTPAQVMVPRQPSQPQIQAPAVAVATQMLAPVSPLILGSAAPIMMIPMMAGLQPPPQQDDVPPGEEPPMKKTKTEDQLIPEEDFLRTQPEVISIRLAVPHMTDKPEWNLNGQTSTLSVPLRESFGALKQRIQEVTGMPPAKQKLVYDGIFVKDNNSLAFYNVITNGVVQLQLKERGGRKK